jgi:glycosyltransferase involved in cell wall biosynthesis
MRTSMALTVSVVTPARDASEQLPGLLAALAAQRRPADEVIVVDDGSRDATSRIAGDAAVTSLVLAGAGGGPGAARNLGASRATGDVLAFTDADCRPHPDWLARALPLLEAGADVVQGAVSPPEGVPVGPWDRTIRVAAPHGLFETANLLIRRGLFEAIGGFEPWLAPRHGKELGEDVWLGWRAVRAGADVRFAAEAVVEHLVLERGPAAFLAERARVRFFPELARRIPELRDGFLYRRWFLTRRSAAFDLALAGAALGARRRPCGATCGARVRGSPGSGSRPTPSPAARCWPAARRHARRSSDRCGC